MMVPTCSPLWPKNSSPKRESASPLTWFGAKCKNKTARSDPQFQAPTLPRRSARLYEPPLNKQPPFLLSLELRRSLILSRAQCWQSNFRCFNADKIVTERFYIADAGGGAAWVLLSPHAALPPLPHLPSPPTRQHTHRAHELRFVLS